MKYSANDMKKTPGTTDMCDHDNPWLLNLAEEIAYGVCAPADKARRIFRYASHRHHLSCSYSVNKHLLSADSAKSAAGQQRRE
jgi:hypothetical protein